MKNKVLSQAAKKSHEVRRKKGCNDYSAKDRKDFHMWLINLFDKNLIRKSKIYEVLEMCPKAFNLRLKNQSLKDDEIRIIQKIFTPPKMEVLAPTK